MAKLNTVFPRIDATATVYFTAGIGAAFIRGWLLLEGSVYLFQHITLVWPLPQLHAALIIVLPLYTGIRQHCIHTHAYINRHTEA